MFMVSRPFRLRSVPFAKRTDGGGPLPAPLDPRLLTPRVVPPVAPPFEQHQLPQPAVAAAARAGPPVGGPEVQVVARRHAGDLGRVKELGEVFYLPYPPRPRVAGEAVPVNGVGA